MRDHGYGAMGWMWLPMALWTLLAIAGLVVLILVIVRLLRHDSGHVTASPASTRSSMSILDERFARGEIDEDEYLRRRETLQ